MAAAKALDEGFGGEEGEGREAGEEIVGKFGSEQLEHEPGAEHGRQGEPHVRQMAALPGDDDGQRQDEAPGKERRPDGNQVVARPAGVPFEPGGCPIGKLVVRGGFEKAGIAVLDLERPRQADREEDRDGDEGHDRPAHPRRQRRSAPRAASVRERLGPHGRRFAISGRATIRPNRSLTIAARWGAFFRRAGKSGRRRVAFAARLKPVQPEQREPGHRLDAQRHRPFGQKRQGHGDAPSDDDAIGRAAAGAGEKAELADRDPEEQDGVGQAGFGGEDDQGATGQHKDGQCRRGGPAISRDDGGHQREGQRRGGGRGEAGREHARRAGITDDLHASRLAPVDQRRLGGPNLVIQPRHHPVAALEHLPRALGIARLVAVPKGNRAVPQEVHAQRNGDQRPNPFPTRLCQHCR